MSEKDIETMYLIIWLNMKNAKLSSQVLPNQWLLILLRKLFDDSPHVQSSDINVILSETL